MLYFSFWSHQRSQKLTEKCSELEFQSNWILSLYTSFHHPFDFIKYNIFGMWLIIMFIFFSFAVCRICGSINASCRTVWKPRYFVYQYVSKTIIDMKIKSPFLNLLYIQKRPSVLCIKLRFSFHCSILMCRCHKVAVRFGSVSFHFFFFFLQQFLYHILERWRSHHKEKTE